MMNNDRLAVAAHLHTALRRRTGRITDVEWLARDDTYAREVLRLAQAQTDAPELQALALRLQALLPPATRPTEAPSPATMPTTRYVRSLR
jgi:Ser/Thr protein kinase RdoA (MazF antagonist)